MTAYNIVNAASLVAGQNEDISQVLANFTAIATVINGGIDDSNIAAGAAIAGSKLGLTYSAYTPTWTSSGTAPAFGDASITARSMQAGKHCHAYGRITFGAGSTYGTGNWSFALPVNAAASMITAQQAGSLFMYHAATGATMSGNIAVNAATTMTTEYGATYGGTLTQAGVSAPWTWATGDILEWNILYETV